MMTLALALLTATTATAQGTKDDYQRAYALRGKYAWKVKNGDARVRARRGEHKFWYGVYDGEKQVFKAVNADSNTVTVLPENPERPRRHEWRGPQRHWMEVPDEKDGVQRSPDGRDSIYHQDNNLWMNGRPLTTNGDSAYYYSAWGSFSPDGRYFATVRIKPAPKHYVYYVESSPRDAVQPVLHKQEYAKPGDSLNYRVPVIVEVATGRVIEPSTELFERQYYVSAPRWDSDSQTVTFEFNERGHKTFRVLELSALTGEVRTLIEERNDKYVNYNRQHRHDFADGHRILWTSERDGYNHIYLYDRGGTQKSGARREARLIRQVTRGDFYVRDILHIDEEHGIVYFSANGMTPSSSTATPSSSAAKPSSYAAKPSSYAAKPSSYAATLSQPEDPYFIRYYKIGLDGKHLTCLTPETGHHQAVFTDDMAFLVDTWSTVSTPPVTVLRSGKNGKILRTLETADITALEATGWQAPEVFVAKGRDGTTDMWGLIQCPSNFDPTKKYPVIEYIYSGPGDQYVPKSFGGGLQWLSGLAELGFIVVQLDAMTTSFRSRAFEEVCHKNLADAGLPDRIAWIKAAAERYPYMDIDRVGIYGCSAGGQNALAAVLFHGDFYKAAYAACGCHDNRMDKIWWNEQWMGYPVDSSYIACSNVENAYRLNRPLMLLVGELDDNVDPASTMQVVDALVKAGKDFELVVIPGVQHTMGEAYGEHKRYDFFVRHLLGVTPPAWDELKE